MANEISLQKNFTDFNKFQYLWLGGSAIYFEVPLFLGRFGQIKALGVRDFRGGGEDPRGGRGSSFPGRTLTAFSIRLNICS